MSEDIDDSFLVVGAAPGSDNCSAGWQFDVCPDGADGIGLFFTHYEEGEEETWVNPIHVATFCADISPQTAVAMMAAFAKCWPIAGSLLDTVAG